MSKEFKNIKSDEKAFHNKPNNITELSDRILCDIGISKSRAGLHHSKSLTNWGYRYL